jgi:diaminopropionate ammonia-lyase
MTPELLLSKHTDTPSDFQSGIGQGDPWPFHKSMPGYEATPLYDCPTLAKRLGVATVLVKDESLRLGLPSFKMLGASWATANAIQRHWLGKSEPPVSLEEIKKALASRTGLSLAAATDGNHGRGVARMAKLLGLECSIFVPSGTALSRIEDIASEGASVTVVPGTYDDAILRSAEEQSETTLVISDTSWEGYIDTPADVIRGYSTMFREIDESLIGKPQVDVVSFQSGVGSFAAAGLVHYKLEPRSHRPFTVIVEPEDANSLMKSAERGEITEVPGPHRSMMAGLNCGLPSMIAWPIVSQFSDAFLAVDDEAAYLGMQLFAELGIVAGESGAATLGAFASLKKSQYGQLGLDSESVVLFINTEGATDPVNYLIQVGKSPEEVLKDSKSLIEKV